MRRDPNGIITAHIMDPKRKELYVEGKTDRTFITWLAGNNIDENALVEAIDDVDLPGDIPGGAKGRLLSFARMVDGKAVRIRFFADTDFDRLLGNNPPSNVWLTDYRDMEGYFFQELCFEKLIRLGILTASVDHKELLDRLLRIGCELCAIRIISIEKGYQLPFQNTDMMRCLTLRTRPHEIEFDMGRYVKALFQNAGISIKGINQILVEIHQKISEFPDIELQSLVHGKDAICILDKILESFGLSRGEGIRILRSSFERSFIANYPILQRVIEFISIAHSQEC